MQATQCALAAACGLPCSHSFPGSGTKKQCSCMGHVSTQDCMHAEAVPANDSSSRGNTLTLAAAQVSGSQYTLHAWLSCSCCRLLAGS